MEDKFRQFVDLAEKVPTGKLEGALATVSLDAVAALEIGISTSDIQNSAPHLGAMSRMAIDSGVLVHELHQSDEVPLIFDSTIPFFDTVTEKSDIEVFY